MRNSFKKIIYITRAVIYYQWNREIYR